MISSFNKAVNQMTDQYKSKFDPNSKQLFRTNNKFCLQLFGLLFFLNDPRPRPKCNNFLSKRNVLPGFSMSYFIKRKIS